MDSRNDTSRASILSGSAAQRRAVGSANPQRSTLSSTIGSPNNTNSSIVNGRNDPNSSIPVDGTMGGGDYPRPALPPPLPPVERDGGSSAVNRSTASLPGRSQTLPSVAQSQPSQSQQRPASALRRSQDTLDEYPTEQRSSAPAARPPLAASRTASRPPSAAAQQRRASSSSKPNDSAAIVNRSRGSSVGRPSSSSRARSSSRGPTSDDGGGSSAGEQEVEELMPLPLAATRPVERFFVETQAYQANREGGQPRNENELLLEQFAEYTDDDSFFSSGSSVIECNPNRMASDPTRGRATKSVHETLQLRQLTNGRVPQDTEWNAAQQESWIYQIHHRAIALQYSSFFVFPARWMPRVVVYNVMHHWVFEMCLFLIILGYSIFQASWARHTAPKGELKRPDFMLWADVFYTVLYGLEIVFRLFATGFILHKRAFLRSPWHWLDIAVLVMAIMACTWWPQIWNFTAWRLIRCIKCLTYIPVPVRMKLLAKSLLRSTNKLINTSFLLLYFVFFFGLLGLQLYMGTLRSRCVNDLTGEVTDQICRYVSTGQYWVYWGHSCPALFTCVYDAFPNPHFGLRSFDDIGHAMLSTFQIMTFQGWTSLLSQTSDGLALMGFLYYAFTIVLCAWVVPSLFLGVFIEKIERTSRLFVLKQLIFFDGMLQEQRQRMSATVRLNDYVQRDEEGRIAHYPAYAVGKNLSSTDEDTSNEGANGHSNGNDNRGGSVKRTDWTDEQRLQLQLSLTRQRHVAEDGQRLRSNSHSASLHGGPAAANSAMGSRRSSSLGPEGSGCSVNTTTRPTPAHGPENFALGGRVGAMQHHPAATAIGASRQTELPFAVRQDIESDRYRFLDLYTTTAAGQLAGTGAGSDAGTGSVHRQSTTLRGGDSIYGLVGAANVSAMMSGNGGRPPLAGGAPSSAAILAGRESVGVVSNRRSMSAIGSAARVNSSLHGGSAREQSRLHASAMAPPQEPYVVHDPEGGDFRYADTCWDKFNIIRNIVHMFSEGYPRILSQFLWENTMMQYSYGLRPLTTSNRYEEAALFKLRQRRAAERAAEREEMRLHGVAPVMADDDEDEEDRHVRDDGTMRETRWMREEGLVAGSMSTVRMAENIRENAPVTVFQGFMYFFILANAVFNASRFDSMPDYWEEGTFVAGVCFSALFTLELLVRFVAMGPGPFFFDLFNIIEATFVIISLFQLGFSRANTISLFNWVRFLKLFRVMRITPLRRVTRVLIHGFPDIFYALIFFTLYMFMWVLLGMSFFGSRIGWIDYANSDYYTRGNFDSFSHAAFAVAQAFSVNRDEWLYLSWSGMRVRGSYTVMYFIATVFVAFVFRFFFIAVLTWAWQSQEEREEYAVSSLAAEAARRGGRGGFRFARLPWFDFTVWRSFKHIHGGFERRDVAPDEVYFINGDMRRHLRIAEAKDRSYKEVYERALLREQGLMDDEGHYNYVNLDHDALNAHRNGGDDDENVAVPQFISVGGQLYRRPAQVAPATAVTATNPAAARAARHYPATRLGAGNGHNDSENGLYSPREGHAAPPALDASRMVSELSRPIVNPLVSSRHSLSPARNNARRPGTAASIRGGAPIAAADGAGNNPTVAAQLLRLGRSTTGGGNGDSSTAVVEAGRPDASGQMYYLEDEELEHLLLPGPRLRYKSVYEEGDHRVFERCLDCNTFKQMPLRAPLGVAQRTADDLHAEHCHMAAVRSSRQLVLNTLLGFVRMQADHEVAPSKRLVETILGQAWGCGMLLFDSIENLSCVDLPADERDWGRMLRALEMQQWLLGLHVGEEQVGRATLAYVLAHQQRQEEEVHVRGGADGKGGYTEVWQDYSFFALSPTNPFRRFVTCIVDSPWFEAFILLVIFAASVCLAVFTPGDNNRDMGGSYNGDKYKALHILDDIFSVIFAVEMVLKWISMGVILPVRSAYFWHCWNIVDCFIVVISLVSWGLDSIFLRYLKVIRCFRILGPLRFWRGNRSMANVARAIWDSIPTLANVCLIMLLHYIVWAIIFVSMFMNKMNYCSDAAIVNRTECLETPGNTWYPAERNFRNFYESLLTTFEISTGGEWMDVMYGAVDSWSTQFSPRTNRHPYLGLVFIAYYYLAHFVLFSLFMASLIYCYMVAKNAMDGTLTAGTSREHQVWLRMQNMILDLRPGIRLLPMNCAVSRFFHRIVTAAWFEIVMGIILLFNMVTMALQWYGMNHTQWTTLNIFQYVWVGIFTVEVLIRLIAHGPRFFTRWSFCWDLLVMCLSYVQIGCNSTTNHHVPFNVNVLRMLRVTRFLNLVELITPVRTYIKLFNNVLIASVPGIINVTLIYMLSVYVFAILGLHFLGYIVPYGGFIDDKYNNFGTFVNALIMVFRLGTLENWATMLRGSLDRGNYCGKENRRCGPTDWAPVFYVPIVLCVFLLMSTMYLAVIVDNYVTAVRMHASVRRLHELLRFSALWARRDPNGTLILPVPELLDILEELRLPLGLTDRRNRIELLRLLREYGIPDHNGYVYYYEVLLPMARRVMAISFAEETGSTAAAAAAVGGGFEETSGDTSSWRAAEGSLGALGGTASTATGHTLSEHYAASYVQAAYRRDRAQRDLFLMKSAHWRKGRAACDEQGLPYSDYGFGNCGLAYGDPREAGQQRGYSLPEGAAPGSMPTYADPVNTRIAARVSEERRRRAENEGTEDGGEATLLPSIYRTAIVSEPKRFGPDAPDAIRRHERRSEKLHRRRDAEGRERSAFEEEEDRLAREEQYGAVNDLVDASQSLPNEMNNNRPTASRGTNEGGGGGGRAVQPSLRRSMNSLYNTNPNDASYQPPLGTSMEQLRYEEQVRRQQQHSSEAGPSNSSSS